MELERLPFDAALELYQLQAQKLLVAHAAGDPPAIGVIHANHPRFLDSKIRWLPLRLADSEIQKAPFALADARLTIARWYDFRDWQALEIYVASVENHDSPIFQFEAAVEAVIAGDVAGLKALLLENEGLIRRRSTRETHFDPPVHRATLLHYVAANGVERYRQKVPHNAAQVARILLQAGAEADAVAEMYGESCTMMSLLVSSSHPAHAGVQVALVDTLLDFGAGLEAHGLGKWASPLLTALAFGQRDAAEALVRRGARVDTLAAAAGLGKLDEAARRLTAAVPEERHRALALAAQHGHVEIVRLLLDAGEDPSRYNPQGNHPHSTPLHQAVAGGHEDVVRLLAERGAGLGIQDTVHQGTPLGWALHLRKSGIEKYLRAYAQKIAGV